VSAEVLGYMAVIIALLNSFPNNFMHLSGVVDSLDVLIFMQDN